MAKGKPIRVFWSPLSHRFYASRAYQQTSPNTVTITGEKFDVTDDIAAMVLKHDITFSKDAKTIEAGREDVTEHD